MSKSTKSARPSDVRAFARANGLSVGKQGLFSAEVVEAWNAANPKNQYRQGRFIATRKVTVKRPGKPPLTMQVNGTTARAALKAAGVNVPARGRLSKDLEAQFILLGR